MDIAIKSIADLRKKYMKGQTYSIMSPQYGPIGGITPLSANSERILLGCYGDCPLRDIVLSAIAKAQPACDYNVHKSEKKATYYFKSHVGMNLTSYVKDVRIGLGKFADYVEQGNYVSFFYLDINLTNEITVRLLPNGTFDVYNKKRRNNISIFMSDKKALFHLTMANHRAPHQENYIVTSPDDFFMPLIWL